MADWWGEAPDRVNAFVRAAGVYPTFTFVTRMRTPSRGLTLDYGSARPST